MHRSMKTNCWISNNKLKVQPCILPITESMLGKWTYKVLTVLLNNLCHNCRTYMYAWAQLSTQFKIIMRKWCHFILRHHPFEPLKLTKLAYVGDLSRYNQLWEFPIQFIDALCRIEPYAQFKIVIQIWCYVSS